MRVAAWNLHRRPQAWSYLLDELRPDVALLQEVAPPVDSGALFRRGGIGDNRRWGSAIHARDIQLDELHEVRSRHSKSPTSLHGTWPGTVVVAVGEPELSEPVTFVSVYGLIDQGYAITTVHRILSDLTPLLDTEHGRRLVVGGDLNCSTQLGPPDRERHRNLFERFASLGLVDLLATVAGNREPVAGCPCEDDPCRHVQTHRHPNSRVPWQDDYLFATEALARQLDSCEVLETPWELSDHRPVVAAFDLRR